MTPLSIQVPFPVFQDRDGQPLDNGYVWLGVANLNPQTNPVVAYYDAALTIVATQPLRTMNGYISNSGTPAQVYVDAVNFSILVQDSKGTMVYNFPEANGISPDACGVTYNPPFTGGVAYPVCEKLAQSVSVKDFGATGDGVTNDTAAIQAALNASEYVYVPEGVYKITTIQLKQERSFLFGPGQLSQIYTTPAQTFAAFPLAMITVASTVKEVHLDGLYLEAIGYGTAWVVDMGKGYPGNNYYPAPCYGVVTYEQLGAFNNVVVTNITNCRFEQLYGGGVKASGAVNIVGNNFIECTGYKPIHDPGQGFDADGDGIYITNNGRTGGSGNYIFGGLVAANRIFATVDGRAGIVCEFNAGAVHITGNDIRYAYERGVHLETNGERIFEVSSNRIEAQNCILAAGASVKAHDNDLIVFGNTGKIYENLAGGFTLIGGCNNSTIYSNRIVGFVSLKNYQAFYSESGALDVRVFANYINGRISLVGPSRIRFYDNSILYSGNTTLVDSAFVGGGAEIYFENNEFTNVCIKFNTQATLFQIVGNTFAYQAGVTTYTTPLTFDGIGVTKLVIDENQFSMTNNTATAAIYWAGNSTTGALGSLSGNVVSTTGTQQIIEPGRTSSNHPMNVKSANIRIHPSTNVKFTLRLLTVDLSGYQGRREYGTAAPTTGTWEQNDNVVNIGVSAVGQTPGWICVASGTPGTWGAQANLV